MIDFIRKVRQMVIESLRGWSGEIVLSIHEGRVRKISKTEIERFD